MLIGNFCICNEIIVSKNDRNRLYVIRDLLLRFFVVNSCLI